MINEALIREVGRLTDGVIANRKEMFQKLETLRKQLFDHEHGPRPEDEPLSTLARDAQTNAKAYGVAYTEALKAHNDEQYAHVAALRAMEIAAGR